MNFQRRAGFVFLVSGVGLHKGSICLALLLLPLLQCALYHHLDVGT